MKYFNRIVILAFLAHLNLFATSSTSIDSSAQRLNAVEIIENIENIFKHPVIQISNYAYLYIQENSNAGILTDYQIYLNQNYCLVSKVLLAVNDQSRAYFGEDLPNSLIDNLKEFIVKKIIKEFKYETKQDSYYIVIIEELIEFFQSKVDSFNKRDLFLLLILENQIHGLRKNFTRANNILGLDLNHKEYESGMNIIKTYFAS